MSKRQRGLVMTASERGQALTEYALIATILVVVLFAPWLPNPWLDASGAPVDPDGGGRISIFLLFVKVFDIYLNSFHAVITLPVP
jgi:hypothetical protein